MLVRGEAHVELTKVLVDIAAARAPGEPCSVHEQRGQKAYAAPVFIALGAAISTDSRVPKLEQLLSVGAATMNMLNAIHAMGYGGFCATSPDAYDPHLHAALDFEPNERLLGFLFVSSPKSPESTAPRPPRANHVREWLGRTSV